MSAAPLPYSRSNVTIRIMSVSPSLSHRSLRTSGARIVFLQEERQHEHNGGADRQDLNRIDVGQRLRLRLKILIQHRLRLSLGIRNAGPGMDQLRREPAQCVSKIRIEVVGVHHENSLMKLRAPRQQRCHQGGAYAAADIPHEIDHASYGIAFLHGKTDIGGKRDGNEEKAERKR